nr:cytochrome b/b6 domain-containing protein [Leucobacter weissii]
MRKLLWIIPIGFVVVLAVVLIAKWALELPPVASFVVRFPGITELPDSAPEGIPVWLAWQHFLNAFFMLLIIRTGLQVRSVKRPAAYWTRNNNGMIRTKNPPTRMSLNLWFHLTMDALWVLNGLVFFVLIFSTGQWMRIVPTSWEIFPNAISALLQYAAFDWPVENGWVNYNSVQVIAYFVTVFIAAPLSMLTGIRMSGAWPRNAQRLNRIYPIEAARAMHFPVMIYFCVFVFVHVLLVFTTGARKNLNHMFAAQEEAGWLGFLIFGAAVAAMAAAWLLARPVILRPIAALTGKVGR